MATEQPADKATATERKLSRDDAAYPQQPQIGSPLSNDGLELIRDTHC